MQTAKYIYWQEGEAWLGYLEEYPDYWTQGDSLDDLIEHLTDLFHDLTGGQIPGVRRVLARSEPSKAGVIRLGHAGGGTPLRA